MYSTGGTVSQACLATSGHNLHHLLKSNLSIKWYLSPLMCCCFCSFFLLLRTCIATGLRFLNNNFLIGTSFFFNYKISLISSLINVLLNKENFYIFKKWCQSRNLKLKKESAGNIALHHNSQLRYFGLCITLHLLPVSQSGSEKPCMYMYI